MTGETAMEKNGILIGLCGRSGSGKGYVSELFRLEGIPSVDTDLVYREMTAPGTGGSPLMQSLADRFGGAVIAPDGSLDRAVLRSMVFAGDRQALYDLNRITHRSIIRESVLRAYAYAAAGFPAVLLDAPLLFESGADRICRKVICVTAPEETLIRRIMRRDGISEEEAGKRLLTQRPAEDLTARADYIIENNGDDDALIEAVRRCAASLFTFDEVDET